MLLEVKNICKEYYKKLNIFSTSRSFPVLKDISFTLEDGEILGILGESGCGKSTLSRLILRLENPSSGDIVFMGENIKSLRGDALKAFRRSCQIVFQNSIDSLNPNMKIIDALLEPLNNHFKISRDEKIKRIKALLSEVGLDEEILNRYPSSLSGGECQRVNILRALLLNPRLLICDEITSSLDVKTKRSLLELIKGLNKSFNMSIIFISHDISVLKAVCSRLLVMMDGEILEEIVLKGEPSIKTPYSRKLLNSSPIKHPSLRKNI